MAEHDPDLFSPQATGAQRSAATLRAHALLLGERITIQAIDHDEVVSAIPFALRVGQDGLAVAFRYGAVVLIGLGAAEEAAFIARLRPGVSGPVSPPEEETALIQIAPADSDAVTPAGVIQLREHSVERLSVIADALAKSVALAHHEREVAAVLESMEPLSRALASAGAPLADRRAVLRLIGSALRVQQRVSGRVAVREKPDLLWDRPDLERLYGRLEDEYEIIERAETLDRKLQVVGAAATAMIDLQDTDRSRRLELWVVVLILVEVGLSLVQLYMAWRR